MSLSYPEAVKLASQIVSSALLQDIETVLAEGVGLDKAVQRIVREIGHDSLEQVYAGVNEHLSAQYQSSPDWVLERRPVVQYHTLFGPVTVESPYWSAREGGGGVRPMKTQMGVAGNRYSEAVERVLADFGIEKSFARAAQQFEEHYGWTVERGTVERQTKVVAGAAKRYLEERLTATEETPSPGPETTSNEGDPYVVELDGCKIRTAVLKRADDVGKTDRDPDDWVRVVDWQEVRTGFVRPLSEQDKLYVCLDAPYDEVCQQLVALAQERGLRGQTQTIGIGDGGHGLPEALGRAFEPFHYILDLGHLRTHFYETADALGIEQKLRHPWVKTHLDKLWNNQVVTVLEDLSRLYEQTDNDRLRRLIKHLNRFVDAVDYGRFRDNDWPIGSGEVESAHRYIPQERLKIPGACWHPRTINPMLALRVVRANHWWDDFWQWLHAQRQQQQVA
jgi:hypothetical protein